MGAPVSMMTRIIETEADLAEGAAWLATADPAFAPVLSAVCPLPLRRKAPGFATLLDAIVSQQVSVAAAAAIWGRLQAAGLTGQGAVLLASEDDLRRCGLSRAKVRYAQALAMADLDWPAHARASDDEVAVELMALPGIGRWTAEVYLLSALGRADVLPAGDLALQEAARVLFDLDRRPSEAELREMGRRWQPWRAVAARALWAYYRQTKAREGIR